LDLVKPPFLEWLRVGTLSNKDKNNEFLSDLSDLKFYEYNPWMSQTTNIVEDFLTYLKSILYTETGHLMDSEVDNYIQSLNENFLDSSFLSFSKSLFSKQKISFQLRKQQIISKYVDIMSKSKEPFRLVILIDNLDRLGDSQVLEVLELVKEVADFPMITFVLAYDSKLVLKIVKREKGYNDSEANHFLQKIINGDFSLKFSPEGVYPYLRDIMFKKYENLYKETISKYFPRDLDGKSLSLWQMCLIEAFRKKHCELLINNIGYEERFLDNTPYLDFYGSEWHEFKKILTLNNNIGKVSFKNNLDIAGVDNNSFQVDSRSMGNYFLDIFLTGDGEGGMGF
jgi:hypothetical protein